MSTVTVSPKFQVVIPKKARDSLQIHPGQKIQVITYNGRIELIPVMSADEAYGFLEGMNTTIEREKEDRI